MPDDYEQVVAAIFDLKSHEEDRLIQTIRAYILRRLAKTVLSNDLQRFESGHVKFAKFPEVYAIRIRKALALLSDDLFQTRSFFKKAGVRVSEEHTVSISKDIQYEYWHNGVTGKIGGMPFVLKKEVKHYVNYYLNEAQGQDNGE